MHYSKTHREAKICLGEISPLSRPDGPQLRWTSPQAFISSKVDRLTLPYVRREQVIDQGIFYKRRASHPHSYKRRRDLSKYVNKASIVSPASSFLKTSSCGELKARLNTQSAEREDAMHAASVLSASGVSEDMRQGQLLECRSVEQLPDHWHNCRTEYDCQSNLDHLDTEPLFSTPPISLLVPHALFDESPDYAEFAFLPRRLF